MIGKLNIFYGPHVNVKGISIRWDSHTCFVSAISQLWIGKPNAGRWGMAKETDGEGLNIELISGSVNCFISSSHDFLVQVYELICEIVSLGHSEKQYSIDFEGNQLKVPEEEKTEEKAEEKTEGKAAENTVSTSELVNPGSVSLKQEIRILIEHYRTKENPEPIILKLLEEIADRYDGGDSKDLQELYQNFIQLSLINDCNELGLNLLIAEVKTRIYG